MNCVTSRRHLILGSSNGWRPTWRFARAQEQPCYINTGCCSFSDGSLTGIEIAADHIRLVRWHEVGRRARREVLASGSLKQMLRDVAPVGQPPAPG